MILILVLNISDVRLFPRNSLVNAYLQSTDLQVLQWWTEAFVTAITQSTKKMPYGMRYLAHETLQNLRVRST
jgi:hypothetical protein